LGLDVMSPKQRAELRWGGLWLARVAAVTKFIF
jgi:hypothetical protein